MKILQKSEYEGLKGSVHLMSGALLGLCALYNVAVGLSRQSIRNMAHGVVYGLGAAIEIRKGMEHLGEQPRHP